jgi:hypothetical protein
MDLRVAPEAESDLDEILSARQAIETRNRAWRCVKPNFATA